MDKVHNDEELQNWGKELCQAKEDGGAGLKVSRVKFFVMHDTAAQVLG